MEDSLLSRRFERKNTPRLAHRRGHNEQPHADPRLLSALAKADLNELATRLLGLARKKMCRRWKGLPPSGETPDDVVQKAFHQALSGVRKFPKENVDLYAFFVMSPLETERQPRVSRARRPSLRFTT